MGASAVEPDEEEASFERSCHICGNVVESKVWYARTDPDEEGPRRVYACPSCYFELTDEERGTYYRERV